MKNKKNNLLPTDYEPFDELILCNNRLVNVKIPFEFKDKIPLLIGKGDVPLVWLSSPSPIDPSIWRELVRANIPIDKRIFIDYKEKERLLKVKTQFTTILEVVKHTDSNAEITQIDLKPLGLKIYGDQNSLYFGGNKFSQNNFINLKAAIKVG